MIILNNCIDCGRVPFRSFNGSFNNACYSCKCGRAVASNGDMWSREVAADMWNRANPVDSINLIAHTISKKGLKPFFHKSGLLQFHGELNGSCREDRNLLSEIRAKEKELTEFYRKRLEPAV